MSGQLTSRSIRAADLSGGGVVAVDRVVLGGASLETSTASLRAGVAGTADGLLGLVSGVVLAADDAEQLTDRGLVNLVGPVRGADDGLGDGLSGEGESRQSSEGLDKHFG